MNVSFAPADQDYITSKIADGIYADAEDLVRDAVRRLREADDMKNGRLMAALEIGEQDIQAGRVELYTPGLLEEIVQEARLHASLALKSNPDVCP